MSIRVLNRSQRVVIVIGLALALGVVGEWLTTLGSHPPTGWVAYSPLSSQNLYGGLHPWVRLVLWLLLITVWVVSSTVILRTSTETRRGESD